MVEDRNGGGRMAQEAIMRTKSIRGIACEECNAEIDPRRIESECPEIVKELRSVGGE